MFTVRLFGDVYLIFPNAYEENALCTSGERKREKNLQDIAHQKFQFLRAILLCKRRKKLADPLLYMIENSVKDYSNIY